MKTKEYKTLNGLARGVAASLIKAGFPYHKRGHIQSSGYAVGTGITLIRVYYYSYNSKAKPPEKTLEEVYSHLHAKGFKCKIQNMPAGGMDKMRKEVIITL